MGRKDLVDPKELLAKAFTVLVLQNPTQRVYRCLQEVGMLLIKRIRGFSDQNGNDLVVSSLDFRRGRGVIFGMRFGGHRQHRAIIAVCALDALKSWHRNGRAAFASAWGSRIPRWSALNTGVELTY